MIELRLHRTLYRGTAIDEAMKLFTKHAAFEQAEEPDYWVVRVTAAPPAREGRERRIAGELANYALGLTIVARDKAGQAR